MTENYQADLQASRRRAGGWIVLGALLLGLLLVLCTCRDSRLIQADLWNRGRAALESKGYDPNILSMNGRDAVLTGTVPTEAIKADAEAVLRSINGIRQVALQNNLAVASTPAVAETPDTAPLPDLIPQRDPTLSVAVAAGTVTLSGLVAGGSKPQILEAATELYGEGNVIDNLEVADDVAEPNWLAGALGLLPQVKNEVQEGRLEATSEGITLSGTAASEQAKAGLGVAAQNATGLEVKNNLAVAAPELKPASFAFRLTDGKAELTGTVPEATVAPAVEAASSAVGAENVINNLQVASDVAEPSWGLGLFSALPTLAEAAPDLGLEVTNNTVTLRGTVASPENRESLAKQVQDAVGAEVNVDNELEVARPPQLRVKISPDAVQLSGTVSQTTADTTVQIASTVSSTGSVVNQLTVSEDVAEPAWLPKLLEQLPTFTKDVQAAELSVQGSTITLLGAVPSDEQKTTVENNIRQAVGEDPTLVNQLRVVAPVVEVQPTLNISVAENAVSVSGNVAQATAEQIAEAVTKIPDATLTNQLITAENVAQPEWLPNVIGLIPIYKTDVQQAKLDIKDNRVTLEGVVANEEKKTELGTAFTEAAGEGVTVVNNLQIETAEPVALRVKVENGVAQLEGNVPEEIAETLAATVDNAEVNNEIQAASNVAVPDWLSSVVNLLPTVTTEVKNPDVTIKGDTITLEGVVESEEQKTDVAHSITEAAGADVEVINNLTVEAPATPEPVQLRVQIQDGVVTLEGNVPEATATQLSEAMETAPDAPSITNEIEAVPNVQVPTWLPDVVAALPEVTQDVADADVSIVADTITLSGIAPTEERKTEIAETVKQAAGPDVNVVNNLEVAPEPQLRVSVTEGVTTLEGNLPTEMAEEIASTLDQAPATTSVMNEIQAAANVQVPEWLPQMLETLPQLTSKIENADVTIDSSSITLEGVVTSEEHKTEIATTVTEAVGTDVNVVNNLTVVPEAVAETEPATPEVRPEETTSETPQPTETAPTETPQAETPSTQTESEVSSDTPEQAPQAEASPPQGEPATTSEAGTPTTQVDEPATPEPALETPSAETEVTPEAAIQEETVTTSEPAEEIAPSAETETLPETSAPPTEEAATTDAQQPETTQAETTQEETAPTPVVVAPTRNPDVRIEIAGNTIRLTGVVPSAESVTAAVAPYTEETVENLLEPSSEVVNAPWLPKLYEIAPRVASDLNRATLVLSDTTLTIQGTAPSVEMRDAIGKYVNDALQPDVTVINRLSVQLQIPFAEDGK
jgi:osmotically-inducible protein OsmY